jgi:hypothetical protein
MQFTFERKQIQRLTKSMAAASRFIDESNEAVAEFTRRMKGNSPETKHFAAAKRASMDLTRALADLRRSPYKD